VIMTVGPFCRGVSTAVEEGWLWTSAFI